MHFFFFVSDQITLKEIDVNHCYPNFKITLLCESPDSNVGLDIHDAEGRQATDGCIIEKDNVGALEGRCSATENEIFVESTTFKEHGTWTCSDGTEVTLEVSTGDKHPLIVNPPPPHLSSKKTQITKENN